MISTPRYSRNSVGSSMIFICVIISFATINNAYIQSTKHFCYRGQRYAAENSNDCSQLLTKGAEVSSKVISTSNSLKMFDKISRALLFSSLGFLLQNSISNGVTNPSAHARDNVYDQSSLFLSDSLTTKVPLSKDTIKTPASTKSATTNTATTTTPKLAEEAALEGAINKRNSGRTRLDNLNLGIKTNQAKLTTLKNEIKALESIIKKTDSKIKKVEELKDISTSAEFDDSQRKILKELNNDKSLTQKKIGEKNIAVRSAQTAIERDTAEVTSLKRRLKSDDEFVKDKQLSLKSKLDSIAKQKAELRAQEIQKEVKAALAEKVKAEQSVKKAVEESKALKSSVEKMNSDDKKLTEQIKSAQQLKKAEEQALVKATAELDSLTKKQSEAASRTAELKIRLSLSDKAVKDRMDIVDVLAGEVRRVSSKK